MNSALTIRVATEADLDNLMQLYLHLTPNNAPLSNDLARNVFRRFQAYEGSAILLGETGGGLATSCTLVVVPNLTRGGQPYGLVENVVTHSDYRRLGFGKLILDAATDRAWHLGCYKVMLLTGSKAAGTLSFYAKAGFEQTKTGFQKRRMPRSKTV